MLIEQKAILSYFRIRHPEACFLQSLFDNQHRLRHQYICYANCSQHLVVSRISRLITKVSLHDNRGNTVSEVFSVSILEFWREKHTVLQLTLLTNPRSIKCCALCIHSLIILMFVWRKMTFFGNSDFQGLELTISGVGQQFEIVLEQASCWTNWLFEHLAYDHDDFAFSCTFSTTVFILLTSSRTFSSLLLLRMRSPVGDFTTSNITIQLQCMWHVGHTKPHNIHVTLQREVKFN